MKKKSDSSELARIQTFSAKILRFENSWLSRSPRAAVSSTGQGFIGLSQLNIHDDPAAGEDE